ncbi:MAG: hypothetical protein HYV51_01375 [Parcubacteria group bacterium]|nr:hypothetical protein [Parcubacteria group bacterium]
MKNVDNKKIIGFDLDGVIINHAPVKIKLAKEFGFKLRPKETQSEIIKTLVDDLTLKQIQKCLYHDHRFFKSTPLMRGAKSGLLKLKKSNSPFFLISRRSEPEIAVTALKYYGLWPKFFNEKNVFFVAKKEDKNIKAREIGVTHYVDDETGVLEKLVDVKNRFLFDNLDAFKNIKDYNRVKSWKELMRHFLK